MAAPDPLAEMSDFPLAPRASHVPLSGRFRGGLCCRTRLLFAAALAASTAVAAAGRGILAGGERYGGERESQV